MRDWATALMNQARPIAELLDDVAGEGVHRASWREQLARLDDPDRTPSARILANMRKARVPFFRFAMNQSILHKGYFVANPLNAEKIRQFESLAERSINEQHEIESADTQSLDEFLAMYLTAPSIGAM
jgi:glutamate--cysteine ligase